MHLLRSRPVPLALVLAVVVPIVFGAICGYVLGINEIAYVVLSLLGIAGGYFAGYEHDGPGEGALRGLVGGSLFGGFILLTKELTGEEPKAELPDPEILLLVLTTGLGVILGALGGRRRAKDIHEPAEAEEEKPVFSLKRLSLPEFVGFLGAGVLLASLFMPWFGTSETNENSTLCMKRGGDMCTAWETFALLDYLLLAACIAPFVLAYILVRGHKLTWRPGEVTMIVGMIAFSLVLLNGIILGRPGERSVEISLEYGYLVALAGAAGIGVSGLLRQAQGGRARKPPGSI